MWFAEYDGRVTGEGDGGKRDADAFDGMSKSKPGEPPAANDNQPFDEKAWRKNYMREYMRRKRERLRATKLAKEQAS